MTCTAHVPRARQGKTKMNYLQILSLVKGILHGDLCFVLRLAAGALVSGVIFLHGFCAYMCGEVLYRWGRGGRDAGEHGVDEEGNGVGNAYPKRTCDMSISYAACLAGCGWTSYATQRVL